MSVQLLQRNARILMWLVTIPFAALALLTLALLGNIVLQGGRFADTVAIYYLPMFLYMWAIWMVRSALRRVAEGALFENVIARLLLRAGIALFCGAVFTVFGVPLATALVQGEPYIATFDPSPVTLGIVGATLAMFSQLFGRAVAVRQELDEFI
ncbi:DUF2975 domain-containing protein [Sphingomonas desiccabilis]|uniref:DUF2975 domain-containing protein n=1 Tax=Sphingomonas desiccabilis TaxID=429134 RepID=A0A4Q2IYB3_9SPHN|nr:DUF2975 domain-containing protein [Sphingomonas desiccabilis]MBB3909583.1 hypothetical protein [Sphingomonas desiccabilis]RXZ34300.1 DUF2975 domain-containing protein [Sphingomonas desiccabilis]